MNELDIDRNRKSKKYTLNEQLARILWMFASPFFRYSFRTMFSWRRFLLRLFGAKIGKQVNIYNSAIIYMPWNLTVGAYSAIGEHAFIYNLGPITIGESTTISHRAHLCAGSHDYQKSDLPLIKPPIILGNSVWVCADAFVGPGVTVGNGAVIGARAVAMKNIDAWTVVAGNPAQFVRQRNVQP